MERPPSLFLMLLLSELYQLPVLLFSWLISSCFYMAVFLLSFLLCLSCLSINFSVLFCFLAPLPFLVLFLPLSEKVSTFPHRLQLGGQCPQKTNFSFLEISEMEFFFLFFFFHFKTSMATAGDRGLQGPKHCSSKTVCWLAPERKIRENKPQGF